MLLHRPGNELKRLTPRNNDQLLFDSIPWVDRAQAEHDAFAEVLRNRGVDVLLLADALRTALKTTAPTRQASTPRSTTGASAATWPTRCVRTFPASTRPASPRC